MKQIKGSPEPFFTTRFTYTLSGLKGGLILNRVICVTIARIRSTTPCGLVLVNPLTAVDPR
jgi:hypothetical protein